MELKYTRTGDYELPNLTLNDNKKGTINKYGMLRLDYLKAHKKALYTTLLMKDELTNHLVSVSKNVENLLNNLMKNYILHQIYRMLLYNRSCKLLKLFY